MHRTGGRRCARRWITRFVMGLAGAVCVAGCVSSQDATYGIKTLELTDVGGYVEFVTRRQERELSTKTTRSKTRSEESIFEESVRLDVDGSVLHPNLFEFGLGGLFGLVQERFEDEVDGRRRSAASSGEVLEFDFDARLFKKRNTPATLFAHRRRGFVSRPFLPSLETTTTSYGFTWQYVSEKTPTSLQFNHTEATLDPLFAGGDGERPGKQQNTELRFETAYHFNDHHKISFDYERQSVSERPFDLDYDADELNLTHDLKFGAQHQHRLRSELHYLDQRGTIDIERRRWREDLRLEHSETLESRYEFEMLDRTRAGRTSDVPEVEERSLRFAGSLRHKLFESQTLQLRGFVRKQKFKPDLEITRLGGQALLNYHKTNRWGLLRANYGFRADRNESRGGERSTEIIDESHAFRDPAPVTLTNANIVITSITLRAEDGVTFFRRGEDYTVRSIGNVVEILRVPTGRIADGQTVLTGYLFTVGGDFDLDTVRHNLSIQQEFDFGLMPYYRFEWQDQTLEPNDATGAIAEDIEAHTLGVEFRKSALSLFAEYEDRDSTINPFRSSRLGASYTYRFRSGAQSSMNARWTDTMHRAPSVREVRLLTLEGRHRHPIAPNLTIEGAVLYRTGEDSASRDTDGVDVEVSLEWFVRATEIKVSFELNDYEDDFTRNESSALFVHVKRGF